MKMNEKISKKSMQVIVINISGSPRNISTTMT